MNYNISVFGPLPNMIYNFKAFLLRQHAGIRYNLIVFNSKMIVDGLC